ncbi:MAG: ABC transporter substrate-binding protein [Clostridia bacterium]|nr:ABC transporter substrate-binding protein [Clostridia bacterium]
MKKRYYINILMIMVLSVIISGCDFNLPKKEEEEQDTVIINSVEGSNLLNLGIDTVDTFNPLFTSSSSVYDAMQLIFEPLFSFDDALNPICVLAEGYTVSGDRKTYTINIKQGVKWHDGTDFNAIDVLHTINLIRYNETNFTSQLQCISSASCIDNYTLSVTFSRAVPNPESVLSFPIVQNSVTAENPADYIPIGTGPYLYNNKSSSNKISLIVNEQWRGNKPSLPEINLNILKDKAEAADAFNASETDIITSETMDLKSNTPRGEISINDYVSDKMVFLGINNGESVLSGTNTRKAISYLIDKESIVTNEIFSRAVVAKIPVNPSAWYCPDIPTASYDSEYIREILALDGWYINENGVFVRDKVVKEEEGEEPVTVNENLKCDILVNDDNDERYRIAQRIGDALNGFGIESSIILVSFEDYTQRISDKNYQLFIGEVKMPGNMDPYNLVVAENYFSYYTQQMHEAVYRLGTYASSEEEKNAFTEYANLFNDEMPFVPLFFRIESVIFENRISGTSKPNMFTSYVYPENWYFTAKNNNQTQ